MALNTETWSARAFLGRLLPPLRAMPAGDNGGIMWTQGPRVRLPVLPALVYTPGSRLVASVLDF
jgi:hypothetical protein